MQRNDAYTLLTKYLHNKNLQKHCIACEAAMKGLYRHFTPKAEQNEEAETLWGIAGLLHDIDYEIAQKENKLDRHGILIFEEDHYKNDAKSIPPKISHAIKAHNFTKTGVNPESQMDWAITCVDQLTGLIVAAALIHPEKKLEPLTTEFIMKRFGEKAFAKGADREMIRLCEEKLGIPLQEFIEITLSSMKEIHQDLGL